MGESDKDGVEIEKEVFKILNNDNTRVIFQIYNGILIYCF